MTTRWTILPCLFLSGVMLHPCNAATTAPIPTLTINRHAERRAAPVDLLASETASRDVNSALTQFRRAANEARIAFETSTEYTNALLAFSTARAKLDGSRAQIINDVRSTPEYFQQTMRVEKVEARLSKLRRDGKKSELFATAHELLAERALLSKLESAAMERNSEIAELRQACIDATAQLAAMRENFAQELRRNPEWQQAKADYEDAKRRRASIH